VPEATRAINKVLAAMQRIGELGRDLDKVMPPGRRTGQRNV
jgi:hypothetical protein